VESIPDKSEVIAPERKANVVHACPRLFSTKKKIRQARMKTNTAMNLYSVARKALDPRSMKEAISNINC
jgi:hypothetical protein